MKPIIALFGAICLATGVQAQGISFENGTWNEVVAKATKEHKLIYLDVYTTWCGPCKIMASTLFPKEEAGKKYNTAFINYKIDAEKGEGITLAEKYKVDGYPTNLYVDPVSQEVVYRVMGSTDMTEFLKRADVALAEQKDPMKWSDYEAKFKKGSTDKAFLKAYITKAERLNMSRDKALDAYVEHAVNGPLDEETLKFLLSNTETLDSKAVGVLVANKDKINSLYPDNKEYFASWSENLAYGTLKKAIDNKDEGLLAKIETETQRHQIPLKGISGMHYYRKEYYTRTGNSGKAWEAKVNEANYLAALSPKTYEEEDKKEIANIRASLTYQLKAMNVPEEKWESSIAETMDKNPDMKHPAISNAAQLLNESAWGVVEDPKRSKENIATALKWSAKSLEMVGESSGSWPIMADTYANLLYLNGDKNKAIGLEEKAIQKAVDMKIDAASLQETIEKMRSGKL